MINNLKQMIKDILEIKEKIWHKKLKMNDDVDLKNKYLKLINNEMPNYIKDNFHVPNYKVWGSVGMGQYAEVPWVAIIDPEISTTTQEGFDIVFLFHPDGEGVYLSLNQGWKAIQKSAREYNDYNSKELAISLSKRLSDKLDTNFNQGVFKYYEDDKRNKKLGNNALGYSLGSIYYKYYSFKELTNSDIENDLKEFIRLYKVLTSKVSRDFYLEMLKTIEDYTFEKEVKEINTKKTVDIVNAPTFTQNRKSSTTSKRIKDKDLKMAIKENELTGDKGEKIAMQYFQDLIDESSLGDYEREQFKSVLCQVSKKGHGYGYDIEAFNPENLNTIEKKYIEVKATTSKNIKEPFFLSLNEVWAIKENPGEILIMRLYDIKNTPKAYFIDPYKHKDSFDSIEELLETLFVIEPISYKIIGVK
ncbi:hypothetical protein BU073_04860 [Mammaliicoccus vitulinus]|nr:hypothetical protein BU073_04860 [Mammaliicoccus vitulinus]